MASFAVLAIVVLSGAALLSGCGSSGDSSDSQSASTPTAAQSGTSAPTASQAFYSSINSLAASLDDSIYSGQDGDDTEIGRMAGYAKQIERKTRAYEHATGVKAAGAERLHALAVAAYTAAKANDTAALARMHDVLANVQTKLAEDEATG